MSKTAKFFTMGLSPDGAILRASYKVCVLHELSSFFIEDRFESSKGVVVMGCLLRGEGVVCKVDVMKDCFLCDGVLFATGVEGWCPGKNAHPWRLCSWVWCLDAMEVIKSSLLLSLLKSETSGAEVGLVCWGRG